jgi:uncharacterized protein YutE (UPF0331/DUF86 family)
MKTKLIDKINVLYDKIKSIETELSDVVKDQDKLKNVERFDKIMLGTKVFELQKLNNELFNSIEIFFDVAEGTLDELSEEVKSYYLMVEELKKPTSETDPEEIKKIKQMINTYKQNGN